MNAATSSTQPPLRIAVAGAGLIGRRHIELVQQSGECTLAAIVDPSPAAAALADGAKVPHFKHLSDLLAQHDKPDGVILATPNHLHVANAFECIDAGVAALVEKPVAHTVEEAERLAQAVARSGARVLVGHHRAHSPILAKAREIIQQGALGKIVAVTGTALFYKPDNYFGDTVWRTQIGGGPILINLIHEIGNLRSLCGEIVSVQAAASNATRGFDVEDTAAMLLRFASGALGAFVLSDTAASTRSWEQTSQENRDYASDADEDCYGIVGTHGSLSIPTMRLKRFEAGQKRSWYESMTASVAACERLDPLALQLIHFCAVIRGEAAPLVSVRDGLQNLRVVEALAQAARSGAVVEIATQH
ncbi:Gfo/Idh/MocA family oxidoreductase [Variovorax sp. J22R133]|uniref:Gfo/Idh/MocA family protein n=1 Tax=Variovorax brevis TaxID=3053503 RepID=UPI0025759390|nr:Gfo/Idh/MocA family oxidoreductase [Variovorax sp. J22R133]MDM0117031.1 Gfo/Idh/MocA family oxidoreductase [Variovorax sp. J22R133]